MTASNFGLSRLFFLVFSLILISMGCQSAAAADDQFARMHRGMNIMDGDPVWDRSAPAWFKPEQFDLLRDAGFDTVRINLHTLSHTDASGRVDAQWFATLDRYVHAALADGLTVSSCACIAA